jgi:hypothetical protein
MTIVSCVLVFLVSEENQVPNLKAGLCIYVSLRKVW